MITCTLRYVIDPYNLRELDILSYERSFMHPVV